jgi:hypothetical protein
MMEHDSFLPATENCNRRLPSDHRRRSIPVPLTSARLPSLFKTSDSQHRINEPHARTFPYNRSYRQSRKTDLIELSSGNSEVRLARTAGPLRSTSGVNHCQQTGCIVAEWKSALITDACPPDTATAVDESRQTRYEVLSQLGRNCRTEGHHMEVSIVSITAASELSASPVPDKYSCHTPRLPIDICPTKFG